MAGVHASHKTRISDASSFDEICTLCGATDTRGSTELQEPCPQAPPSPPVVYGTVPRRWRKRVDKHPNGSGAGYFYGCYFPKTDLCAGEMGTRGTGMPNDVEWLDEPAEEFTYVVSYQHRDGACGNRTGTKKEVKAFAEQHKAFWWSHAFFRYVPDPSGISELSAANVVTL